MSNPDDDRAELARLRARVAELEARLGETPAAPSGAAAEPAAGEEAFDIDLDRRKRFEVALVESNERLKAVLDGLDAAVSVIDFESYEILFMNAYARRRWGSAVGQKCWSAVAPGQEGLCDECVREPLVGPDGRPSGVHVWEARSTADGRWYEWRAEAMSWWDGRLVRIEIATDISARKQSEARFRTISEAALDGVVLMDAQGLVAHWNPAAARMFGYTAEEIMGASVHDLLVPQRYRETARAGLQRFAESGEGKVVGRVLEVQALRRDGVEFPVEVSISPIEYEGQFWAVAIIRDITHRRRMEQALRESEERFSKVFHTSPAAITLTALDSGEVIDANEAALRLVGYSREEVIGRTTADIRLWPGAHDRARIVAALQARKTNLRQAEMVYRTRSGQLCHAEASMELLELGGRQCVLTVANDITARKQAEEKLRRERELLQELLDLHDRERRLIAYEIHDGLAQQLAGASFLLQTARSTAAEHPEESARTFETGLNHLSQALAEARRLIGGLRPPVLEESGVVAAIDDLVSDVRRRTGIEIEFVHQVHFDRLIAPLETALFRVAQETLSNAQKHSASERVRLEMTETDGWIRIVTRDWGIGFDREQIPSERFGLRGIEERARLFGGRATIDSRPGAGTVVTVELPMTPGRAGQDESGPQRP